MLFTDHDLVSEADVRAIDADVDAIAKNEINLLEGDGSVLRLATEEVAHWLTARMQTFTGYAGSSDLSANHLAAVMNIGGGPVSVPAVRLSNIVVDNQYPGIASELRRFGQYTALHMLFRAAWNRKINDRYEAKSDRYEDDALKARARLEDTGLPTVTSPLPCPAAKFEPNTGLWSEASALSLVLDAAGTLVANVAVVVTYVGAAYVSPAEKNNAESGPSRPLQRALTVGNVLRVDITALNPPTGAMPAVGTAQGLTSYIAATGWNVYAGAVGQPLTLQNATPIPIATKVYTLAGNPTTSGAVLGTGQFSNGHYHFGGKRLMRA